MTLTHHTWTPWKHRDNTIVLASDSGRLLDGVEVCEVPDLTTKGSD